MRRVRHSPHWNTSAIFASIIGLAIAVHGGQAQSPFVPVGPDKKLETSLKNTRVVDKVPASVEWKLDIKPYSQPKVTSTTPISLPAQPGEGVAAFLANRGGDKAILGYKAKAKGVKNETSRIVLCDLAKSSVVRRFEIPGSWVPVSLSDDAVYAVMRRSESVKGQSDQLQIWNIAAKDPALQLEFTPYSNNKGAPRDVRFVSFLPKNRLMTLGGVGLAVWDLKTGQGIYKMPIQADAFPSLSPDQKLLAFTTKSSVGILDVDEGKVLVSQPVPRPLPVAHLAFNPDGTKLACLADKNIFIWNVADGSLYRDIPTAGWGGKDIMVWTGVKDLKVGPNLVDIEIPIRYWEYKNIFRTVSVNGFTWFFTQEKSGAGALIPAEIPHAAARKTLEKAKSDPNILVLKPGTKVNVDVSALTDPKARPRAAEGLKLALEKNGFKVDPAGTITLAASTDLYPEPIELKYRFVTKKGDKDGPVKSFNFQVHFARLKFVYAGESIWESSAHNLPGDITLEPGETPELHLKKHEMPKYEFFQIVALPRILLRTKGATTLGTSQVTVAGIR